ncbi:flagellar basal-body MS-ring/collar protein FliF [Thermodesulfobacterium hydrogeniphilum]|uniref:flagellar basal-body MS-ring/collar protein FliF n=1 Tax=Thermodesulfobacterium hydrogeniphilum TaxID=161156 RepID=UPI00056F9895|nr:flagellar basal-body MS-ring/collar protein FliF [Thermodesulfobacterium hydrogeniphilum]
MIPDLKSLPSQLKEFWNKLNKQQKISLIGGSIGLTLAIFLTIWFLTKPNWGLLYRGLDEQTTDQIIQYLKTQKIPYKIEADGSIYVPKEKVPELRMEIAGKGLVGGTGPGFELFDKEQMGLTEFQEKVNYQRALQGELERSIKGIRGIKYVRVHLALPKESLFIEEEKPPKASVLIRLKPGYHLSPSEIRGIINLVSGAVPKLEPQNITIIDADTGKSYKLPSQEEEFTTTQLAYKKKIEEDLKNKIEELLGRALGYGKAVAQVSVDLSFDKKNIVEETYDPESKAVVSEETEEEQKVTGNPPGGIPGVKGSLAQKFEATSGKTQGESYLHKKTIKNYNVSKKVTNLEISPGSIKKISVAVLIDKSVLSGNDTAKIAWIEDLVKGAIGYNPDRGDVVKVEAKTFVKPPVVKPGIMDYVAQFYKPILLFVGLILFFIFVIKPLIKALSPKPVPEEAPEVLETKPTVEGEVEEKEGPLPHEIALGIIQSQPEKAAVLIKKWLLEESLEERKKALAEAGY